MQQEPATLPTTTAAHAASIHIYMYIYVYAYIHIYIYIYIHMHIHKHTYINTGCNSNSTSNTTNHAASIHIYMYICTCTYIHIYIQIHTHIYTNIHISTQDAPATLPTTTAAHAASTLNTSTSTPLSLAAGRSIQNVEGRVGDAKGGVGGVGEEGGGAMHDLTTLMQIANSRRTQTLDAAITLQLLYRNLHTSPRSHSPSASAASVSTTPHTPRVLPCLCTEASMFAHKGDWRVMAPGNAAASSRVCDRSARGSSEVGLL